MGKKKDKIYIVKTKLGDEEYTDAVTRSRRKAKKERRRMKFGMFVASVFAFIQDGVAGLREEPKCKVTIETKDESELDEGEKLMLHFDDGGKIEFIYKDDEGQGGQAEEAI